MGFPAPDLVFTNDTPYGIMIWTSYTDTSLTVTMYSSPHATAAQTGIREGTSGKCTDRHHDPDRSPTPTAARRTTSSAPGTGRPAARPAEPRRRDHPTDVAVVGGGPAGAAAAIDAGPAGRRVDRSSTRPASPGQDLRRRPDRRRAPAASSDLGLDPAPVPSWQPVDDVVVRGPVRPRGHLPAAPGPAAPTPPSPGGPSSTPPCSTWPGRPASTVARATPAPPPPRTPHRVTLDGRGPRRARRRFAIGADGMWSPLRKPLGAGDARLPGRVARLPPVLRRRRPPGRSRPLRVVRARPAARATPGRSRCRAGGPTSASASSGRRQGRPGAGHDGALAGPARPPPRRAPCSGDGAEPESPHRAWPIPARIDDSR